VAWPGNDAALLVIVPVMALVCLGYIALLRRSQAAAAVRARSAAAVGPLATEEGAR
jgi:hypothetical protein